jgi:hypothetical protein
MALPNGNGLGNGFPPHLRPFQPLQQQQGPHGGPVQHMPNLGDTEAHLSTSVTGYLGVPFDRQTRLMRIHVSADGYGRFWIAMFFVHSMIRNPNGFRVSSNYNGSLFVSFENPNHVQELQARVILYGAQIISFSWVDVVFPAVSDPIFIGTIIYMN